MWKQRELELVRKYEDQINKMRAQIEDQRKMIDELRRGTSSEAEQLTILLSKSSSGLWCASQRLSFTRGQRTMLRA